MLKLSDKESNSRRGCRSTRSQNPHPRLERQWVKFPEKVYKVRDGRKWWTWYEPRLQLRKTKKDYIGSQRREEIRMKSYLPEIAEWELHQIVTLGLEERLEPAVDNRWERPTGGAWLQRHRTSEARARSSNMSSRSIKHVNRRPPCLRWKAKRQGVKLGEERRSDKESKTVLSIGTTRSQVPRNETGTKDGRHLPGWSVKTWSCACQNEDDLIR